MLMKFTDSFTSWYGHRVNAVKNNQMLVNSCNGSKLSVIAFPILCNKNPNKKNGNMKMRNKISINAGMTASYKIIGFLRHFSYPSLGRDLKIFHARFFSPY